MCNSLCCSTLKAAQFCSWGARATFDGSCRHSDAAMRHGMHISQKPQRKKHTGNSAFSHNITNTCHAPCSAPELHAILSTGCQGNFPSVAHHQEVDMCRDMSHHVPKSAQTTPFAPSGAMDIINTQSHMLQHPGSSTFLFVGDRGKTCQKPITTARLCVEERVLWHAI